MTGLDVVDVGVSLLGRPVVSAVSMHVPAGRWVSLVGPNGAGKSTLLRAIAGTVGHTGRVDVGGVSPGRLRAAARARTVAVVPQEPTRPAGMSVFDYVLLGRTPFVSYLGVESAQDVAVVTELLGTLELADESSREVSSLSGGEFQRAVLARALAQEAPLLLLDEPTSSLDLGHAQQVLELVDRLRAERGLTVVSALHDLTLAGQFSDTVVVLVDGAVAAQGPPAEVITADLLATHYRARVHVSVGPDGDLVVVPIRDRSPANRPRGAR